MINTKYTKEFLEPIVLKSKSLADVARRLGLSKNTGYLRVIIDQIGISREHFILGKYNKNIISEAVANSLSMAQVLRRLNLSISGGNNSHIKSLAVKYNISTSHFTGQGHNKGKTFPKKKNIEEYLIDYTNSETVPPSDWLKKRLLREKVKEHRCDDCGRITWNKKKIPLELHHINGNRKDDRFGNLKLVCPNCHAQYN